MDAKEMLTHMYTVLEEERSNMNDGKQTYSLVHKGNNIWEIEYEHSNDLIDIFSQLPEDGISKNAFVVLLRSEISDTEDYIDPYHIYRPSELYPSTVSLSFYTLIRLGLVQTALSAVEARSKTGTGNFFTLLEKIPLESRTFLTLDDQTRLVKATKSLHPGSLYGRTSPNHQSEAISNLIHYAYETAKKSRGKINLEMNKDKREVIRILNDLAFDQKYGDLLEEIDQFINSESKSVSAGMINNFRTFMQDLSTDLAKRIASQEGEEIPKYEGESLGDMGRIRKYLKIKLELTDNDNSLMNAYVNILHKEGGHSFVSNKEYFRLARNIGIEIALFLLSKYKAKHPS